MEIDLILGWTIYILMGIFIGFHTRKIYHRTGRDSGNGFLIGLVLQQLGLLISLCLTPKNKYKSPIPFIKRFLYGFGRFLIWSISRGIINEIYGFQYTWVDYLMIGFGFVWVLRGSRNFFNIRIDYSNNINQTTQKEPHQILDNVNFKKSNIDYLPKESNKEIMDQIDKLSQLKYKGVLSTEEFNEKKKELLKKIK